MRHLTSVISFAIVFTLSGSIAATVPERDFSGKWSLSRESSRLGDLTQVPEPSLDIEQTAAEIRCSTQVDGQPAKWVFLLNGDESKYRAGAETRNSAVKWEGAALLISTLVSGPPDYVVMDRWKLSADRNSLTVTRQVMRSRRQTEGTLVYRRRG